MRKGQYTITGVQPGDLTIRFVDPEKEYAINTPVKLLPGEMLTKDATFRPGTIHGKVYQPDGVTPTIAQLTVYVPRPEPTIGFAWGLISTDPPLYNSICSRWFVFTLGFEPRNLPHLDFQCFLPDQSDCRRNACAGW